MKAFLITFLIPLLGLGATKVGHNLSATSETLEKGEVSLGNYFVGAGITDNLTIATSPWLIINYNMPMITAKFNHQTKFDYLKQFGFDFSYFKTSSYGMDIFSQESIFSRMIGTFEIGSRYRAHVNFGFQYFFNDDRPFSLRPRDLGSDGELLSDEPTTISISVLNEISIIDDFGIFVETGVLGTNYKNPYGHIGGSIYYNTERLHLQVGVSYSFQTKYNVGNNILHPEIQVQYSM